MQAKRLMSADYAKAKDGKSTEKHNRRNHYAIYDMLGKGQTSSRWKQVKTNDLNFIS